MKKNIIKIQSVILLIAGLLFSSCEDTFDINESPNNPGESTKELTFSTGTSSLAYVSGNQLTLIGQVWSQHWTQGLGARQYNDLDKYRVTSTDYSRIWTELYSGALADFEYVSVVSSEQEDWGYYLAAETMKAYSFQLLTDLYGDIPFSEALRADKDGNTQPKFDSQEDVYTGIITMLDEALAKDLTVKTVTIPGKNGFVFKENEDDHSYDLQNWVKFANSIKLKVYLRLLKIQPAVAEAGIQKMYADGAEFLTADVAMTAFKDEASKRNPFYETDVVRLKNKNLIGSNSLINYLLTNNDTRIDELFTVKNDGAHQGLNQGAFELTDGANNNAYSRPGIEATTPVVLMSEEEVMFLQAEAAVRFATGQDAKVLYDEAITHSFDKHELTEAVDLLAGAYAYPVAGTNDEKLAVILTQKWIAATEGNPIEAFFDFNRTGYPSFLLPSEATVLGAGEFPRRLILPSVEQNRNTNAPAAKPLIERVWWAVL